MKPRDLALTALLALAACGSDHPLDGHWAQDTGSDAQGIGIDFDGGSDKVFVHLAPNPDGTHGHAKGTYTWDAASQAVTVDAALLGDGEATSWSGKLAEGALELSASGTTLRFAKGGSAHGH